MLPLTHASLRRRSPTARAARAGLTGLRVAARAGLLLAASTGLATAGGGNRAAGATPPAHARDVLHRPIPGLAPRLFAARERHAADYDVLHYELALTVDMDADTLDGENTITIQSTIDGLTEVTLHLAQLAVRAVTLGGGGPLAYVHAGDTVTITLDRPYASGETFALTAAYSGHPGHESWGGFWFYNDMAFNMGVAIYTLPPSMGRYWFPCYDEPDDKATVTAHYTVAEGLMAVGNGILTQTTPHPQEQTVTYTWEETHPTSTYLVCIAVADWRVIPDPVYPDWIYHYVLPADSLHAIGSFQNVHRMMDAFTTRYAPYQFDKFSYAGVRKGDMEHQTCVAHLRNYINGGTNYDWILAHEMSHHWWGDWVTIADWRDVWLSEGFATYSEAVYQEHIGGMPAYHSYMNSQILDYYFASGETYPIYDPQFLWGSTSYEKGAAVLHMLRHLVGTETFFEILHAWGAAYGFANAVTTDLIAIASSVTGQDLGWFFDEWVYQPGYPEYDWSWWARSGPQADTLYVQVDQVQAIGPVFAMPIDLRVTVAGSDTTVTALVDQASQLLAFTFEAAPTDVAFDPDRWVLCRQDEVTTAVAPAAPAARFVLGPAAPNPFTLRAAAPLATGDPRAPIEAGVYDSTGRLIRRLLAAPVVAPRELAWDGRDAAGWSWFADRGAARPRSPAPGVSVRIAITREVGASFADCQLTHLERQPIDIALAREQHARHRARLAEMGLRVVNLPAEAELPDAVFVEDPAVVLDELAIITRPGAARRQRPGCRPAGAGVGGTSAHRRAAGARGLSCADGRQLGAAQGGVGGDLLEPGIRGGGDPF